MTDFLNNLLFIFQRFDLLSALDILIVTLIFFGIFYLLRDTQAMVLLRGVVLIIILTALLTGFVELPALSWLLRTVLPVMLLAIPVIFAPEIRRGLERLGRVLATGQRHATALEMRSTIQAVVGAASRLSARQHGALIVLARADSMQEYMLSGVILDSRVTPEVLLQIFYPNTPLHDGAVVIEGTQVSAAACVLPLSSSGILAHSPERQMGLRHRAALGISEVTDAVAVVVSEETGAISVAHAGRMIRRLDPERLENILTAFFHTDSGSPRLLERVFPFLRKER
jgi:diadenylate cyclase